MKQVLENIEAGKLTEELARRGIAPTQKVRAVVESLETDDLPMAAINASSGAFDWLADEPDIYADNDLIETYRT
jgi:hypothetical protein